MSTENGQREGEGMAARSSEEGRKGVDLAEKQRSGKQGKDIQRRQDRSHGKELKSLLQLSVLYAAKTEQAVGLHSGGVGERGNQERFLQSPFTVFFLTILLYILFGLSIEVT